MYNNDTSDIFLAYVGPHIFIIFVELKQADLCYNLWKLFFYLHFVKYLKWCVMNLLLFLAGYLYYLMTVLQFLS